jgi:ketosteroid isomerase-like protein
VSANLDLVRSIYGDWEHGDFTRVDWVDPEIEYEQADGPSPGKWKGLPAVARAWGDALSAWEDFTQRAEEYRQLDAERVLVLTRVSGRGKRSGLELPEAWGRGADLFHIREGKVIKVVHYFECDRALADLGITPAGEPVSAKQQRTSGDAP